jgi:hypothetical protein
MAIDWNKLDEKVNTERARLNSEYAISVQRAKLPTAPLPRATPQIPTAARVRTGTLPTAPSKNVLEEAFDPNENYLKKFGKGNIGGGAANLIGTGLTAAQTLYLNAANSVDSVAQGKGLPKYQPQMSFADYDKAVAERRGTVPTIEQVSNINPALGEAYRLIGEVGTDPLELTPFGFANDIKLAKGLNQSSQAYTKALQGGKLTPKVLPKYPESTPEVKAQDIPAQAPSVPVRPRNQDLSATLPRAETQVQNARLPKAGKVEAKFKDLGADANRFEEVAMVMTDSNKLKPTLLEKAAGITSSLKRKFIDAGDTVSKIAKINNDQGLYNLYNNARNARRRAEYHIGEAQTDIYGKEIGKSLKDIFDPIRKKGDNYYEDFQEYMYHLHNIDRMGFGERALQRLREFEIQHQDLANLEDKQLREILKTADSDSAAVVKEYMKLIDEVNNAPNKPVFGKSITADESRKVSAYLLQQHPEFAQEAAEVRKYLDNLMQYRIQGGLVSEDSANALTEMYKNYVPTYRANPSAKGLKTFGGAANISTGIKKATGSSKDLLPLHEQISKQTMQAVDAAHKNLFGIRLAENINPNTQQFVQELKKVDDTFDIDADVVPELKNTFNVYENGQAYQMKVDDTLYEGVKALAGADPNELTKAAMAFNKGFKELITSWNPMFLIRNVARDIQDVGLYSKNLKGFAKMYPGAVKEVATNGQMWKQYKALGGAGNSFFDYAKGYKKDPSWLKRNTLDRVEQLNMATEQLPRFTEFMATLDKLGHAPSYDELMQAMYNAADVTVNFGRSGTWGKTLNSTFVPFFNPAMQGASKIVRKFAETKGVKEWTELVLKISALGVAPSLINEMVYHDDPQYAMINDREKDITFLFKIGDGEWVKIPKGRVLSMFGSGAQRLYRAGQGDEDAFAGYIKTMGDQVAPISPTESNILSPVFAVRNNTSWYGGRIEPQRLEKYSPGLRYDESTTGLAKAVGGALNYSPKKIDYLLDAYSGVIGDFAIPLSTPRAERNPFTKAFAIDSVTSNKISQQFYDKLDEIQYAKNDAEGADKYDVVSRYMNKQNDMVSDLYGEIRKVENGLGTDAFKREKVREIRGIINGIEQTALDTIPEVERATQEATRSYREIDNRNSEENKDLTDEQYKAKKANEKTDTIYREANKKVFGSEYALKTYNKDTYAKAQKYKSVGVSYDNFYKVYFGTKDMESDKLSNGKTIENSLSKKKKEYIDSAFPNASDEQLKLLYEMAGVSKTIGHYRPRFD